MSEESKASGEIANLQSEPPVAEEPTPAPPAADPAARESLLPRPGYPQAFRHLSPAGKALRVLVVVALVVHLGSMLLGGAITPVRKFFSPVVGFYAEGLRMSNPWGMFGKPPTSTNVSIEAVLRDGTQVALATTDAAQRTLWERIRDVRVRKILGKLTDEGDRARLGPEFMDYFCEQAKARAGDVREVRAINHVHELRDDDGKVTRAASTATVLTRPCLPVRGQPPRRLPGAFRKPMLPSKESPSPGGGDL